MLRWYRTRLAKSPLLTQSATTLVLFATGDVLAQQAVEKRGIQKHDLARTGRMAFYGGAIFGPAATTWFSFLSRRVILNNNPNSTATILTRVAMDQLIFTPTNLLVFLSTQAVLEGSSPKAKIESTYTTAITKNWMIWPWVQLVNFKMVPLEHRVLVVNLVSLGWNCYLSFLNSGGSGDGEGGGEGGEGGADGEIKKED